MRGSGHECLFPEIRATFPATSRMNSPKGGGEKGEGVKYEEESGKRVERMGIEPTTPGLQSRVQGHGRNQGDVSLETDVSVG